MADNRRRRNNRPKRPEERYEPQGNPEILSKPIEDLSLFEKTYNAIKAGGIATVRDLMRYRASEMFRIQNIGKKNIAELERKLSALGVAFRPEASEGEGETPKNERPLPANRRAQNDGQRNRPERDDFRNEKREKKPKQVPFEKREFKPEPVDRDSYIKFNRKGKWGFKDWQGKTLIEPQWDEVFNFKDELACVENDGLCGYIDKTGELAIPCEFELAMSFSEGYAVVSKNEKSGYIDKTGALAIDYKFDIATPFSEGQALVKIDDRWGFVTPDGTVSFK